MDPIEPVRYNGFETSICNSPVDDHGRTKSRRRNRKKTPTVGGKIVPNGRQNLTSKMVSADVEDESNGAGAARSKSLFNSIADEGSGEEKAAKQVKKPIMSLSEAAAKIDNPRLAAFLSESYGPDPDDLLYRFVDFFERELSEVQFPWLTVFPLKDPWPKLIAVPLSDIPEPIYKTSVAWINQLPVMIVAGFIRIAFGITVAHLASQQEGVKSDNCGKPPMAEFVTLAMALRTQPNALTIALRHLRKMLSFQGEDRFQFAVWMIAQATQGDLSVGFHEWAWTLLPIVGNKHCSPQLRDFILQLVEKILSGPKARILLMNRAVKKGERLIPPPSFEILLRLTFPASSARVKATERFKAIYPFLKKVALAGAPGSMAMKQVIQEIFTICLKLAGECIINKGNNPNRNPALAKEATAIAIWCVTENVDCWKHWKSLYKENLKASVAVLKKLVDEWKDHSLKLSSSPKNTLTLSQVVKSFRLKNKKAIDKRKANVYLYKDADKSCKVILWRLFCRSCNRYCLKATTITAVVLAFAGAAVLSSNTEATTALKNLVDLYINAFTTALKNIV